MNSGIVVTVPERCVTNGSPPAYLGAMRAVTFRSTLIFLAGGIALLAIFIFTDAASAPTTIKGEDHRDFAADGAWCWFADPRAVYVSRPAERIYAGWVDSTGSIFVGSLDPKTGKIASTNLRDRFEKDDHANPALLVLPDGRIVVFYSAHGGMQDKGMRYRISERPGDITAWGDEILLGTNTGGPRGYCYPNPYRLSKEKGRIYLFWRGGNFKPAISWTDDLKTWSEARTLIASDDNPSIRPYVKFDSNGTDRIQIAFTDGHPRDEPANSIYYACYRNGAFYTADGRKITDMTSLPIVHRQSDLVYDGRKTGVRAWIWDIAADRENRPVIAYTRLPSESDHRYHYAHWTGISWDDHEIGAAGPWFPRTPEGKTEPEPHYSGGIALDHNDPSAVYLSRRVDGVFEIERRQTRDGGATWTVEAVTAHSSRDNVRPFVIRNHPRDGPAVLWMSNASYVHYTNFRTSIKFR